MSFRQARIDAGTDRPLTAAQQMEVFFASPIMKGLAPTVEGMPAVSGYPPLLLMGLVVATRAAGSQEAMLAELASRGLWPDLIDVFEKRMGERLDGPVPRRLPTRQIIDRFVGALSADRARIDALLSDVKVLGVSQALRMGQLPANESGNNEYTSNDKAAYQERCPDNSRTSGMWSGTRLALLRRNIRHDNSSFSNNFYKKCLHLF